MDKNKGEQNTKGSKLAQLDKERKTADPEGEKGSNSRENSHQAYGSHFCCSLMAACYTGLIKKEQVGNTVVNGYGDNCRAKAQHHDGEAGIQQGVDKQGRTCSSKGWQKREQSDQGPGKRKKQQQADAAHCKEYGHVDIPADNGFIIKGRSEGPNRSQLNVYTHCVVLVGELGGNRVNKGCNGPGVFSVCTRDFGSGRDQQVAAVV